MQYPSEAVKR